MVTTMATATAWADHPQLEEAARLISEASFEPALEQLDEVAAAENLTRAEVVQLLVLRSLVHHALGNRRELDANLTALATLEPHHTFTANVPPAVQSRFESLRDELDQPLGLQVAARRIRGGFQINARIEGDEGDLVSSIHIFARIPGGDWVETEGESASIPVRGDGAVEFYACALGPGNAVLIEDGSESSPRLVGTPGTGDEFNETTTTAPVGSTTTEEPHERRAWPWALLGTGVAAVIAGAIIAGVIVSRQNQGTQLDAPTVEWP